MANCPIKFKAFLVYNYRQYSDEHATRFPLSVYKRSADIFSKSLNKYLPPKLRKLDWAAPILRWNNEIDNARYFEPEDPNYMGDCMRTQLNWFDFSERGKGCFIYNFKEANEFNTLLFSSGKKTKRILEDDTMPPEKSKSFTAVVAKRAIASELTSKALTYNTSQILSVVFLKVLMPFHDLCFHRCTKRERRSFPTRY